MSLANKFNLKTAVEEIKEDLVTDTPPVVEKSTEVANEGDTVDMLEASTPIPIEEGVGSVSNTEEDLEQVPDHTEEMEFMTSEVNKGFEAIAQLDKIAKALEAKETNSVSLESYNDFALIAINNVRSTLGMESEEGDVTSVKTESLSKKVIEAIKKIWEKLIVFINNIINKITNYFSKVKIINDKFQNYIKEEIVEKEVYTIEPRFYRDHDTVTAELVFANEHLKNFDHNLKCFERYFQRLAHFYYVLEAKERSKNFLEDLRYNETIFIHDLKGKRVLDDEHYSIKITPDDVITLILTPNDSNVIFTPTLDNKQKQRLMPYKDDIHSLSLYNNYIKIWTSIEEGLKELDFKIKNLIENEIKSTITQLQKYDFDSQESFKHILQYLNRLQIYFYKYCTALISGPAWYQEITMTKNTST